MSYHIQQPLQQQKCIPCEVGGPPLSPIEVNILRNQVPDWVPAADSLSISRKWKFENFKQALAFVNQVGAIAESEGHHPDISFGWGYVEIKLLTHEVGGLSNNDFIVASKIDLIPL